MNAIVYSAIFGKYDTIKRMPTLLPAELVCDEIPDEDMQGSAEDWDIIQVPRDINPRYQTCTYKTSVYHGYEAQLWLDGSIHMTVLPEEILHYLDDADMAMFRHPWRETVADEMHAAVDAGRAKPEQCYDLAGFLWSEKFKDDMGLWETGLMLVRNNVQTGELLGEWFELQKRFGFYDQFTLPYLVRKHKIIMNDIPGGIRDGGVCFLGGHAECIKQ